MRNKIEDIIKSELNFVPKNLSEIQEGIRHETYRVELNSENYIIQISENPHEDLKLLRQKLYWYNVLHDSNLPTPKPFTDEVKKSDDIWYILVEELLGQDADQNINKNRVLEAGRYLAKLHQYREFEDFGLTKITDNGNVNISNPNHANWISTMFQDSIKRFEKHNLMSLSKDLNQISKQVNERVPRTFDSVICHNDYSPDNVLYNKDDELTGIIDFDIAYRGDRNRDIAKSANSFWMHDPMVNWDVRDTFYRGYTDIHELDSSFDQIERFYRLETLVVTISHLIELDILREDSKIKFYEDSIYDALKRLRQ